MKTNTPKAAKKLTITKESLRNLTEDQLRGVAGGAFPIKTGHCSTVCTRVDCAHPTTTVITTAR